VLLAFSLAVLAFGGFGAAAPLAEETRDPRRAVPIAVIAAPLITSILPDAPQRAPALLEGDESLAADPLAGVG
jgi:hypothetical protein